MGSCISISKHRTTSVIRRATTISQHRTLNQNRIESSNHNILNSFNNEEQIQHHQQQSHQGEDGIGIHDDDETQARNRRGRRSKQNSKLKKNRRRPLSNLNTCMKCTSYKSSSISSLSSAGGETGTTTNRRSNRNQYHDNNNLDYEISDDDDDDENDEDFIDVDGVDDFINRLRRMNRPTNEVVSDILDAIRAVVINNHEEDPPLIIVEMQRLASDEKGWIKIMIELINRIELNDPIGPPIISLFLDECPIPSPDSLGLLVKKMPITKRNIAKHKERNCFVVFSCLGEKVAGPSSLLLMNKDSLEFTLSKLKYNDIYDKKTAFNDEEVANLTVILYALIAIEKFAISTENRLKIMECFKNLDNPLCLLSKWNYDSHYLKRQIGFNAQFLLDNAFSTDGHKFGYESVDTTNINSKLNDKDASEYLKMSPNGLEARNDTLSFESVRCTFQCDTGCWYYEVTVLTNGIMQIGFATKSSKFLNYNGYGIGDDEFSVAYDGCRRFIWYNAEPQPHDHKAWKEGDVIGLLLDLENFRIIFYLNGEQLLTPHTKIFEAAKEGFFAAASFMSFQHCMFNFGREPFKYPPKNYNFKKFNDYGVLNDDEKIILPRKKKLDLLRSTAVNEEACSLCCDNIASVILLPCNHKDFCNDCAIRLTTCPVCRSNIVSIKSTSEP